MSETRPRLEHAWSEGFKFLRRVPDVTLWKSLSYIDSLSDIQRSEFFDLCEAVAQELAAGRPPFSAKQETLAQQQLKQIQAALAWSAYPDRFLCQFSFEALAEMNIDEARIPNILKSDPPVIAKAAAIRNVLHKRLKEQFDAKVTNTGGGSWSCLGSATETNFAMGLDYGGTGQGFYYGVTFETELAAPVGLAFHSPYAIPGRAIDFPMADELDELADVFCEGILNLEQYYLKAQNTRHC